MHRPTLVALLLAGVLGSAQPPQTVPAPQAVSVLWYRTPAARWNEALPIGNGRLGAMVFGGVREERLQLNEDSVWAGQRMNRVNPAAAAAVPEVRRLLQAGKVAEAEALADKAMISIPRRMPPYQALGDLDADLRRAPANAADYSRTLDLERAVATVSYRASRTRFSRECLCVGSRSGHRPASCEPRVRPAFRFPPGCRARPDATSRSRRPRHAAARRAGVAAKERAACSRSRRPASASPRPCAPSPAAAAVRTADNALHVEGAEGSAAADRRGDELPREGSRPPPA